MSIYGSPSKQYWAPKPKTIDPTRRALAAAGAFLLVLVCIIVTISSSSSGGSGPTPVRRRLMATQPQIQRCSNQFRKVQAQCALICTEQRLSLPRPTVHQACMQGCLRGLPPAAEMACQGKSKYEVESTTKASDHGHCSKFQNMRPKPVLFSTCRKYYELSANQGYEMGLSFMESLLESDFSGRL
jgi:hypothetical protein